MDLTVIEYSILLECSIFIDECNNKPLYKHLPKTYSNQEKVKIRLKTSNEKYHNYLDNSINFKDLENRSLKCTTKNEYIDDKFYPYYIFIPDSYKYIYTKDNLDIDFKELFTKLSDNLESGAETFEELLKYSFRDSDLKNGIDVNDQIIFYNIPYYYCIRADKPYKEIIKFYDYI